MISRFLKFAGFLLIVFCVVDLSYAQDRIILVRSDSTVAKTINGRTVRQVIGSVHWYNPGRELHIYCNTTDIISSEDRYVLKGNVKITDPEKILLSDYMYYRQDKEEAYSPGPFHYTQILDNRQIKSDQGTYFYEEERLLAIGNVVYTDSSRTVFADTIEYFENKEYVNARGNVVINDNEVDGLAVADYVEHYIDSEYTLMTGSPRIVVADTAGADSLYISGLKLEFFGGDSSRFVVTDSAVIEKGNLTAKSMSAVYDQKASVIFLRIDPVIYQGSTEISGIEIDLTIVENTITEVTVRDSAVAFMEADTTGAYDYLRNVLKGSVINLYLEDNRITRILSTRNASSTYYYFYENEPERKYLVSGESIELFFEDGKIVSSKSFHDNLTIIPKYLLTEIRNKK